MENYREKMEDYIDPYAVVAEALRCSREDLSEESAMYRTHGWDSVGQISVITAIEYTLGVNILDTETQRLTTMKSIVEFFDVTFNKTSS